MRVLVPAFVLAGLICWIAGCQETGNPFAPVNCSADNDASPGIQGTLTYGTTPTRTVATGGNVNFAVLLTAVSGASGPGGPICEAVMQWSADGGTVVPVGGKTDSNGVNLAAYTAPAVAGTYHVTAVVVESDPQLSLTFTVTVNGPLACDLPATISDDFSAALPWDTTVARSTPGSASGMLASHSTEASGGNPGGYRRMVHDFTIATPDFVSLSVTHLFGGQSYSPIEQGAIDHIRYSEDRIKFSPTGSAQVGTGFVLRQGGIDHIALLSGGAFGEETWHRVTVDLHPEDFSPQPDFSATGGAMTFGYLRSNSARFPTTIVHGIDNWKVEVCH